MFLLSATACTLRVVLSRIFFLVVELERVQNGGRPLHTNSSGNRTSTEDRRFADIIKEKPLKVTIRVLVPVKEHPKVSTRQCSDDYWW